MGFSAKQLTALRADLDPGHVCTRSIDGRELAYLEGWYVVSEANRVFGFDGWDRETLESKCVLARENRGNFLAVYTAKVRITVRARGVIVVREGHGTGQGRGDLPGDVHDTALKAAETDATKRALATFGKRFGLELYRRDKTKPAAAGVRREFLPGPDLRDGFHPDDTTPVPRPSTFYGPEQFQGSSERAKVAAREIQKNRSLSPALPPERLRERIDKSQLPIGEPRRLRDKAHLRFVASQPCLACGRNPSDPHHLRFAQPRAIGMKVSDEFTVPLCRGHHRELHQVGNEVDWWERRNIDAIAAARGLWLQSHPLINGSRGGDTTKSDRAAQA